eukprot:gene6788-9298_t
MGCASSKAAENAVASPSAVPEPIKTDKTNNTKTVTTAITTSAVVGPNETEIVEEQLKNYAFVFIKPHANTALVQEEVSKKLIANNIKIIEQGEFSGEDIDKGMLIDQHYYAIASKATLLKPNQIPVPPEKFLSSFGISWEKALSDGVVYNAIEACSYLGVDATGLDELWGTCKKVKFGGGFYCGLLAIEGKTPIYVFNGFFMSMRSKFVAHGTSIHYYVVEFSPSLLEWKNFRAQVLGPTDPFSAPAESLRGSILKNWKSLGLSYEPNVGDNCVHASASPFEGLAERMNWLKAEAEEDPFGKALISAGLTVETLKAWSVDPQVKGSSIFDQLEDSNADECVRIMVQLNAPEELHVEVSESKGDDEIIIEESIKNDLVKKLSENKLEVTPTETAVVADTVHVVVIDEKVESEKVRVEAVPEPVVEVQKEAEKVVEDIAPAPVVAPTIELENTIPVQPTPIISAVEIKSTTTTTVTKPAAPTAPLARKGYILKQGQMIKSWKNRYFILDNGMMTYYENSSSVPPYGVNLKGEVSLDSKVINSTGSILTIMSQPTASKKDRELILDIRDPKEREEWVNALNSHIHFYTKA